jgi:cytochrome c oxidase cbb3-type subunit 3
VPLIRACALALALTLPLLACEREQRRFVSPPTTFGSTARATPLQAGPPVTDAGVPAPAVDRSPYDENAYGVGQGKTLFNQFNCSGCHALGGGGMGPPLMDAEWIYGSGDDEVFQSIVQGRPNGMPAFGNKIVTDQVWQLVSYVRSMSGLLRKDVAPGRSDDIYVRSQEQATEPAKPVVDRKP